jgi:hypothetical protein
MTTIITGFSLQTLLTAPFNTTNKHFYVIKQLIKYCG